MTTETLANSRIGRLFIKALAAAMESPFRYRFFGPTPILRGADIHPGQAVLEVGCGTGFFTIPAARLIGDQGRLVAMDVLAGSVEEVSRKTQDAGLKNVRVFRGDALDTKLDAESMDAVLLFGVIPAPMLPLDKLLNGARNATKEEPQGMRSDIERGTGRGRFAGTAQLAPARMQRKRA
jgi:SAM-dependent methyltransferase